MDSNRPIRALMRGLEALTVLNLRDGATVSEIAREIRLPRTTVHRILETLCDSGFLLRDAADERYRLTIMVRALSSGFDDEAWVTQVAKPHLIELGESIVWPAYIATLCETKLLVREVTDHLCPLAIERYSAGLQLPLLSTAAGRVYLACCADEQRAALLQTLQDETQQHHEPSELERLLRATRAQGFATAVRNQRLVEEISISVPVILHNRAPAVLAVRFAGSVVPLQAGLERFLPKLRHCAAKIAVKYSQSTAAGIGDLRSSTPRTVA